MYFCKLCSFNGIEDSVCYRSDDIISKYVHGFNCKSNDDEIWSVVDSNHFKLS